MPWVKRAALRTWLNEISSPFNLHCEAGDFIVRFAGTEDSYRGKGKVEIVLKFREDAPVLTGAVMPLPPYTPEGSTVIRGLR